jgi:hypothetical protein
VSVWYYYSRYGERFAEQWPDLDWAMRRFRRDLDTGHAAGHCLVDADGTEYDREAVYTYMAPIEAAERDAAYARRAALPPTPPPTYRRLHDLDWEVVPR